MENGTQVFDGSANDAVDYYAHNNILELNDHIVVSDKFRRGFLSREIEYLDIRMLNDVHNVSNQEPFEFEMTIKRNNPSIKECQIGVLSRNNNDILEWSCYSPVLRLPENQDTFKVRMSIPHHNTPMGKHKLNFNISRYDYSSNIRDYDIIFESIAFEVNFIDAKHSKPFSLWPFRAGTSNQQARITICK